MFKADGVVVSGIATGESPSCEEAKAVRESVDIPVLMGSGITPKNIKSFMQYSHGLIIGSYLKDEGKWQNKINVERCKEIIDTANS